MLLKDAIETFQKSLDKDIFRFLMQSGAISLSPSGEISFSRKRLEFIQNSKKFCIIKEYVVFFNDVYRYVINRLSNRHRDNVEDNSNMEKQEHIYSHRHDKNRDVRNKIIGTEETHQTGTALSMKEKLASLSPAKPIRVKKRNRHNATCECEAIFDRWNSHIIRHKRGAKGTERALRTIDKLLKQGTPMSAFMDAIETYNFLLTSEGTILTSRIPGHKVTLEEFICGFSSFTKERMHKAGAKLDIDTCWFEECKDYNKAIAKYVRGRKDWDSYHDAKLTNLIIENFCAYLKIQQYDLSIRQLSQLKGASQGISRYVEIHKHRFTQKPKKEELAAIPFKIIEKKNNFKPSAGFLASQHFLLIELPKYMEENIGLLSDAELARIEVSKRLEANNNKTEFMRRKSHEETTQSDL